MEWVDLILVLILMLYVWQGWDHSLPAQLNLTFSWIAGWWISLKIKAIAALWLVTHFGLKPEWAEWAGLVLSVLVIQQILYWAIMGLIALLPRHYLSSKWQALAGASLSVVSGFFIILWIVAALVLLPISYPLQEDFENSRTAQRAEQILIEHNGK